MGWDYLPTCWGTPSTTQPTYLLKIYNYEARSMKTKNIYSATWSLLWLDHGKSYDQWDGGLLWMVDGHNHLGWISPPVFIDTKKQKTNFHKLSFFRLKVDPTTQLPPSNPWPQNLKGLAICVLFFYFTYHSCYFENKKQKTYKKSIKV